MSTTIQINSLEALERLIGNDNELEIQLRNSVVQEFASKHLKAIANEELLKTIANSIKADIKTEFFDVAGHSLATSKISLKEEYKNVFKREFDKMFGESVRDFISETIEEQSSYDKIKAAVNGATNWILERLAPDLLEKRLNDMVDKRIKEKLGLK